MNKSFLILVLLLSALGFSQEQNSKDLYIFVKTTNFTGYNGEYIAKFILKSQDKRFSHDVFSFRISDVSGEKKNIFNLGRRVMKDSIEYSVPENYFKNKKAYEIHNELSLLSPRYHGKIFIITEIPKERLFNEVDKERKYLVWEAIYIGTVKDFTYTSLGKSIFLR